MSKLLDSLTGYFFSGDPVDSASPHGSGHGATAVAEPPVAYRQNLQQDHQGADLSATATDSRQGSQDSRNSLDESLDLLPHGYAPSYAGRIRQRIWPRRSNGRPVRRSTPPQSGSSNGSSGGFKPWGDDVVASPRIHPLAAIDPRAELAADVEIGAFCVVGPHVSIGPGCKLHNNVTLVGHTTVGSDNVFFPNCTLGTDPQDKKFRGEATRLVIGDNNHFREHVTVHVGTDAGGGVTRIGDGNLLMVNVHLGHDVTLGDDCILANNVMLAGHCHIGNRVSMMGGSATHHFVSIGDFAFIGGYARVHHDVPPFVKLDDADQIRGVNVIGLRRGGLGDADIAALEIAGRRLFYSKKRKPMSVTLAEFMAEPSLNPKVKELVDFLRRRNLGKQGRYLESLRHG